MWTKRKLDGKKQNIDPMCKELQEEVDLGEPTSFLDHVYLGCTQRKCEMSKDTVENYRDMFESRISAGATEKLPCSGRRDSNISTWSCDLEGRAKKCVERHCELANTTTQQLHKVAIRCLHNHEFREEELGSVGDLSKVSSQILQKCLYLARIGRPDILWSVNKFARAANGPEHVTNAWLVRFLKFITRVNLNNTVMWETLHNSAGWDCFRTLTLLEILKTQVDFS